MHPYKICVVGVGPKGLYAFERLLAQLHSLTDDMNFEIHLFEQTGNFGAGEIYNPEQPEYLIMNYPNRNINAWSSEKPDPIVPETLNFVEWVRKYKNSSAQDLGSGFSARRWVGNYLKYCFESLLAHKRDGIKVVLHTAEVSDIEKHGKEMILRYKSIGADFYGKLVAHEVLLTTGHASCKGKLEASENLSERRSPHFIPFVYPVEKQLAHIHSNSTIGIKGFGLTFIDTVLALTEGRGGKFETTDNSNLRYIPSGNEPNIIFAFSRSGLPMIPRSASEGKSRYEPLFFTEDGIRQRAGLNNKISFSAHVMPLFVAEMRYRYYSLVFEQHNFGIYPDRDMKVLKVQIRAFHEKYPEIYRFNGADLYKPRPFTGSMELGSLDYLRYIIKEAEKGSGSSPFMTAVMTWGRLGEIFNRIYSFGGMTADSHYDFDVEYRSKLNRISYGPPLQNMKKIVTLVEHGVVDLRFAKNPKILKLERGWALYDSSLKSQKIDTLIDARIPTLRTVDDWSPLLTKMRKRGLLRALRIHDVSVYEPGCPEIDRNGKVIDCNGATVPNISFYGTPTEGTVYDNDSLSRTRNNFASHWAHHIVEKVVKGNHLLEEENVVNV